MQNFSSVSIIWGFPIVPTLPNKISPFCGLLPYEALAYVSSLTFLALEKSIFPFDISFTDKKNIPSLV